MLKVVCTRRRNEPRLDMAICRAKCDFRDECTNYIQATIDYDVEPEEPEEGGDSLMSTKAIRLQLIEIEIIKLEARLNRAYDFSMNQDMYGEACLLEAEIEALKNEYEQTKTSKEGE